MADMASTLVFLVAQVVNENPEACSARRGRARYDADRAERAFLATEPELAGLAAASTTPEPSAGCLMEDVQEPISLLLCSLDPVCSTKSTSIRPAVTGTWCLAWRSRRGSRLLTVLTHATLRETAPSQVLAKPAVGSRLSSSRWSRDGAAQPVLRPGQTRGTRPL